LKNTILSILSQQEVSLELIVVDDCSTDNTETLAKEVSKSDLRVRYLRLPANSGGPASPRNHGVTAAAAPWVALCDADDLWHPRKLRVQLDLLNQTGADLICSAIEDFNDGETPDWLGSNLPRNLLFHRIPYWQMMIKDRIATSSVICRRQALLESGGFDNARELVAVEDYDLWLRLMERTGFNVVRIRQPLVAYRRLATSLSANKLRHAIKVMRVPNRAAKRRGWGVAYPLALPFIVVGYGLMAIYWRILKGQL
jgi:glycosyltransferase involved in cell wall biosynthesis